MKKFMTVAAVLAIAACGGEKKAETPAVDSAAMAPAAAPAMAPAADSAAAPAAAAMDSAAKADTTKK